MKKKCLNCGKVFEVKTQPKYYCSDQCRSKFHYDKRIKWVCPPERISKCEYCGEEFDNWRNPNRKYCCRSHYISARFEKIPIEKMRDMSRNEKLAWTLQRRSEGTTYRKIANELDMSIDTVKRWCRRYGEEDQKESEMTIPSEPELNFKSIEVFELSEATFRRIFLICGTSDFKGKHDSFISKVPEMVAYNLQTGDVFVFCKKSRYQISLLQWQGDGFELMFRRTEQEKYPWPEFLNPKAVEITQADLEMLIEYPRFMSRLRGLPTPDIFT